MKTKADLIAVLSEHIGRDRGIHVQGLAARLDCPERHVRRLVAEATRDGVAICGHPSSGYFIAATAEEIEERCQFLRGRALHSLQLEARLRNVPLPDLLGQLHLRT